MIPKSWFLLLFLRADYAYACQTDVVIIEYPLYNVSKSQQILEVKISETESHEEGRYTGTKSFEAVVLQSFSGGFTAGESIEVFSADEEPKAMCPVFVEAGKVYMLVLSKSKDRIEISRFNPAVDSDHPNYQLFVEQITHASRHSMHEK